MISHPTTARARGVRRCLALGASFLFALGTLLGASSLCAQERATPIVSGRTNKRNFEMQNFFVARVCPTDAIVERVHATPGYPFGVTVGLMWKLYGKE